MILQDLHLLSSACDRRRYSPPRKCFSHQIRQCAQYLTHGTYFTTDITSIGSILVRREGFEPSMSLEYALPLVSSAASASEAHHIPHNLPLFTWASLPFSSISSKLLYWYPLPDSNRYACQGGRF